MLGLSEAVDDASAPIHPPSRRRPSDTHLPSQKGEGLLRLAVAAPAPWTGPGVIMFLLRNGPTTHGLIYAGWRPNPLATRSLQPWSLPPETRAFICAFRGNARHLRSLGTRAEA